MVQREGGEANLQVGLDNGGWLTQRMMSVALHGSVAVVDLEEPLKLEDYMVSISLDK